MTPAVLWAIATTPNAWKRSPSGQWVDRVDVLFRPLNPSRCGRAWLEFATFRGCRADSIDVGSWAEEPSPTPPQRH